MPKTIRPLPPVDVMRGLFKYDPASGILIRASGPRKGRVPRPDKTKGYLFVWINGANYPAHRVIWAIMTGQDPGTSLVDHRDRDRSNNRWDNLRLANDAESAHNSGLRSDNLTGFRGVCMTRNGRFNAQIASAGKSIHIGNFATAVEASEAYRAQAIKLHGDFANF